MFRPAEEVPGGPVRPSTRGDRFNKGSDSGVEGIRGVCRCSAGEFEPCEGDRLFGDPAQEYLRKPLPG